MMPDYVALEMRMAELMAQQEASGFRFDTDAAVRVRTELQQEFVDLTNKIKSIYLYVPGKVFTPKRADKKKGYVAGAPMTRLTDFNPTSRQNIAWALQTFRGARFTKVTETGKPKVDEATISEVKDIALSAGNQQLHDECEMFIRLLTLQKWLGQLSEGTNSWFNSIEGDGCIHHSCTLKYCQTSVIKHYTNSTFMDGPGITNDGSKFFQEIGKLQKCSGISGSD